MKLTRRGLLDWSMTWPVVGAAIQERVAYRRLHWLSNRRFRFADAAKKVLQKHRPALIATLTQTNPLLGHLREKS